MNYTLNLPPNYTKPKLPGRDKWTAELRSGRRKQGHGKLQLFNGEQCCLGVLCDLQGRLGVYEQCNAGGLSTNNPLYSHLSAEGVFPSTVYVITTNNNFKHSNLAGLNDAGLTFLQIADIIEAVWKNED